MSFYALRSKLDAVSTSDDLLGRQIRIVSLFLQSEADCRANARAFHAFAIKVWEWANEVQCQDRAAMDAFRVFTNEWVTFAFV